MEKFENLYGSLDWKNKVALKKKIIRATEMSDPSFFRKMRDKAFSKLEKEKIAEILSESVDQLFPDEQKYFK